MSQYEQTVEDAYEYKQVKEHMTNSFIMKIIPSVAFSYMYRRDYMCTNCPSCVCVQESQVFW